MTLRSTISYLIAICLLLNFVDATVPQLEMRFMAGACPVPAGIIRLAIVVLLIAGLVSLKLRLNPPSRGIAYASLFAAYCTFETIYLLQNYQLSYVLFSVENYYFYLLLIPLFFVLRPAVADGFWRAAIFGLTISLAGLGFVQGYTGRAIVHLASTDGNFEVRAHTFFGTIRAFSLFSNSGAFGSFLCISAAFMLITLLRPAHPALKLAAALLLCLVTVVTVMTLSRSVYYEFVMALLTAICLARRAVRLIRYLPLIYGLFGLALAFSIPALQQLFSSTLFGSPVLDDTTQQLRLVEWANCWQMALASPANLLLGKGVIQSAQYAGVFGDIVDNIFLAIILHIGFFGLSLYLVIMANLWTICRRMARRTENILALACISVFSTWMSLGMFTIQPTGFPLIFILALMSSGVYTYRGVATARAKNFGMVAAE